MKIEKKKKRKINNNQCLYLLKFYKNLRGFLSIIVIKATAIAGHRGQPSRVLRGSPILSIRTLFKQSQ